MKSKPRKARYWGPISPLMRRIMAVNIIALAALVGGILYLNQFQAGLLEERVATLEIQAQIIAGALGESAASGPEAQSIELAPAQQIIARLLGPTETRARLYSVSGDLIADSRFMALGRNIYVVPLPSIDEEPSWATHISNWVNNFLDGFSSQEILPIYSERPEQIASDYEELSYAFEGLKETRIRALEEGGKIISVAVPIQRFRRVLGALLISEEVGDIDDLVREERFTILKVFGYSLIGTILLSFFLAGTIARPIRRLSKAADEVRQGIGRTEALKSFSERPDEIGDLSYSLNEMTLALYDRIDAIERFAADVAHEIKNPLTSVRSAVETLERTENRDIQKKLLAIIADDIKRLDRLISDISEASRLDAELSRGTLDKIDLEKLITTLIDAYTQVSQSPIPRIKLTLNNKGPFLIAGIESRLGQVIRNLIDNALSFVSQDGKIEIHISKKSKKIKMEIMDNGPGINEEVGDKIFDRFYSERPEGEKFGTHSGLGLNISKQIVEAHRGSIHVENIKENNEVKGAKFTLLFPES